jgi:CheY-like chemotaxis protein
VETRILDLGEVVAHARPVLERLLGEDTEISCDLDPAPQAIRANADQLEQVLINLALNARDAMPEGGSFRIETRVVRRGELASPELAEILDADEFVMLAVTDSGIGMDSETRARAFDPFFSRKPIDEGTGLGLSLVYGVVKHAGGDVRVLSEPGRGARFELYWPRVREAAEPCDPAGALGVAPRGAERILLVEDDADLRRALADVLDRSGYSVVGAGSAEAALELVAAGEFDLVVSDVVMPRVHGFELMARLRKAHPSLRLLLISGQLNHPSLRVGELPPGIRLLRKPFEMTDLAATVREVLDAPGAL